MLRREAASVKTPDHAGEGHAARTHRSLDGSDTLWSEQFGEYFHNPNGAIAESFHVFFNTPRLIERIRDSHSPHHLLEVGFGTGLNLLILMQQLGGGAHPPVTYTSIEAFPLTPEQAAGLNYPSLLGLLDGAELLHRIFSSLRPGWNEFRLSENLHVHLFAGLFERFEGPPDPVRSILFDPFSPSRSPSLWRADIFERLSAWSAPDVLLSTYGASSGARAAMAAAGWKVARGPGALGKREMTLAALDERLLEGWKRVDEKRLATRYLQGDFNLSGQSE